MMVCDDEGDDGDDDNVHPRAAQLPIRSKRKKKKNRCHCATNKQRFDTGK